MFLFMALLSDSVGTQGQKLRELTSKRRIREERARCDTIPTSAATLEFWLSEQRAGAIFD